jgi:hypothetical protein
LTLTFNHDHIRYLRQHHPILRLLAAQNLPLIAGFLYQAFVEPNRREIRQAELEVLLDDYLDALRSQESEGAYPRLARQYLDEWTQPALPFLRKYYPEQGDEPVYDLTPATERAIEFLQGLEQQEFVGTESRLLAVFNLLREIVQHSNEDADERIRRLQAERARLEEAIARARRGEVDTLDATQIRERFLRLNETVRRLQSDFRQVEENFRELDRRTRQRIATAEAAKGALLDEIFSEYDAIAESDEGRSFRAFWELLLNPAQQQDLLDLLDALTELPALAELERDPALVHLLPRLIGAGERVAGTLSRLKEQLRKFLDDRLWLENRRIAELAREIEHKAVQLKETPPAAGFVELAALRPEIDKLMSRRLYTPPSETRLQDKVLEAGQAFGELDNLFNQLFVNLSALRATVSRLLRGREQITLAGVLQAAPPREGLAEVIGYLHLASRDPRAAIDKTATELIELPLASGELRRLRLPQVIFTR